MYADIIIDISHEKLDKVFQYKVPQKLEGQIRPGAAVLVPFGRGNRLTRGFVTALDGSCLYPEEKVKEIDSLATDVAASDRLIRLAIWMKERYGGTLIASLRTVLIFKEKKQTRKKRIIYSLISRDEMKKEIDNMPETMRARRRLLEAAHITGRLDYQLALESLRLSKTVIDSLVKRNILAVEELDEKKTPANIGAAGETGSLSQQQKKVMDLFEEGIKKGPETYLLQGVTGSGKTRVYIEMIRRIIDTGQQAIVLIPEIALTFQTMQRFYASFGERVSILHSRMSPGERYEQMMKAREGKLDIMIGPRSALFTPFPRLGLIVIDEEHENSYKSEQIPRYHAVETAVYRAKLEECSVVLGSATPSVTSMYRAKNGEYTLLRLPGRINGREMSCVEVVDMRKEMAAGNRQLLSRRLAKEIEDRIEKKEQVMLFLNRRGYAGFLSCRSCGEVIKCPNCDVSLSLHNSKTVSGGGKMVCHYCGYEREKAQNCPACGSSFIGEFKAGTQQVEELVKKIFPKSRVLRMDRDTTSKKGSHEHILSEFSDGRADILIGTQMIVKGHDFPNVTLVGVLLADLSLHSSDYMAAERTFSLLTQAAGRTGRGEKAGLTVIQTYDPDHYAVSCAAAQSYEQFYEKEISYRRMLGYPPAGTLLAVMLSCEEEGILAEAAEYFAKYAVYAMNKIAEQTGESHVPVRMLGPVEASIYRLNRNYRKIVYFKSVEYDMLIMLKNMLEKYIEINPGFARLRILFDFNPIEHM